MSSISQSKSNYKHSLDAKTSQEHEEIKWHSNLVSGQFKFLKIQGPSFPFAKNNAFIGEIGRDRSMSGRLAIDGRDHASVDQNGAIKSHLSDHRWRIRMRLCYTL